MSKFFRSPHSDESSTTDSESSDEEASENATGLSDQIEVSRGSDTVQDGAQSFNYDRSSRDRPSDIHRDALLHALLEERCVNEVIRDHMRKGARPKRPTDEDVQIEARRKYQNLCARLAPLNLVSVGLEHDRHSGFRQKYRDGLDLLSRANLPSSEYQSALPAGLRRFVTGIDSQALIPHKHQSFRPILESTDALPAFNSIMPSRYIRDFDEIGQLGKGGYGQVFSVRHRLDGCTYAIKKIPIRQSILAQVHELESMLIEVRALSKLDHPNVVRYFGSWIEWATDTDDLSTPILGASVSRSRGENAIEGPHNSASLDSLRRIVTESEPQEDEVSIHFETSSEVQNMTSHMSAETSTADNAVSSQSVSVGSMLSASEPTLALHIQMDEYPITLADYLCPKTNTPVPPLAHCFHVEPSVRILLALLDGVEYLHSEGIVHRDLKPANIFLRIDDTPKTFLSATGAFSCSTCHANRQPCPTNLRVRIGDFGLVTHIARIGSLPATSNLPVGTEIYRPVTVTSNASPDLDIFALGIIACELLCKFNTQMERRATLNKMRDSTLRANLKAFDGSRNNHVKDCVFDMLSAGSSGVGKKEIRISDVRERLSRILDT